MNVNEDLDKLLETFPSFIKHYVNSYFCKDKIIEIILDLGCRPEIRLSTGPKYLSKKIVIAIS